MPLPRRPASAQYVQNGWNVTGDTYIDDADGYFWYQARSDDMIVSSGYNIAGPEVEAALLAHPRSRSAASSAHPTRSAARSSRPMSWCAPARPATRLAKSCRSTSRRRLPRTNIRARSSMCTLPRTQTGKLQRFELRRLAAASHLAPARIVNSCSINSRTRRSLRSSRLGRTP